MRTNAAMRGEMSRAEVVTNRINSAFTYGGIELMTQTEIAALQGGPDGVERVRWRDRGTGVETEKAIRNVFLFIGADPAAAWLSGCGVEVDKAGFIVTRGAIAPLQTSVPGVFAVGDVRSGSVKRVASAVGEGSMVVQFVHAFLAEK